MLNVFYAFLFCVVCFKNITQYGTQAACVCGEFIQPPLSLTLRSFAEEETRLPCEFKPQDDAKVIQVTWSAEKSNGVKEQIITRHMTEGLQGAYTHHVYKKKSN